MCSEVKWVYTPTHHRLNPLSQVLWPSSAKQPEAPAHCLASLSCAELGTAQPQLVMLVMILYLRHKLKESDFPRRLAMCQYILQKAETDPTWLSSIWTSDEANFNLNGRYISDTSQFLFHISHHRFGQF